MSNEQFPRRIVFHGLGALGAAVALAGCGEDDGNGDVAGEPSESPSKTPTDKPTKDEPKPTKDTGPEPLATKDEVPVNGGIVLTDEKIVITQPTAGEFKAFTAVCTHMGCTVSTVSDDRISCPCHGSVYDAATGDNISGPAPAPLAEIDITVRGNEIFEA